MMEQFNSHIEPVMRGWLIDQRPKTLSQLARLADQYLAVHQIDSNDKVTRVNQHKPGYGSGKSTWYKPGFSKSSQSTVHVEGNGKHPSSPPKPTSSSPGQQRSRVVCYYCKKPGHVMAMCHKRLAKLSGVPNRHQGNMEDNQGTQYNLCVPSNLVVQLLRLTRVSRIIVLMLC